MIKVLGLLSCRRCSECVRLAQCRRLFRSCTEMSESYLHISVTAVECESARWWDGCFLNALFWRTLHERECFMLMLAGYPTKPTCVVYAFECWQLTDTVDMIGLGVS